MCVKCGNNSICECPLCKKCGKGFYCTCGAFTYPIFCIVLSIILIALLIQGGE